MTLAERITILVLLALQMQVTAQRMWLNESHYNGSGTVDAFVEVVIATEFTSELANIQIELYNGADGGSYGTHELSTFTAGTTANGLAIYHKEISNLQSTHPAGIALIFNNIPIQFLSYGGTFKALNGAASGYVSADIGVTEDANTPQGQSLQLGGTGNRYEDFTWNAPQAATPGALNANQSIALPDIQMNLTDATTETPASPENTIAYTLEMVNNGSGDANNIVLDRTGDPNAAILPESFSSTAVAIPARILTILEDEPAVLTLKGIDPDGDLLTFTIVESPANGDLTGLASQTNTEATVTFTAITDFSGSDQFAFAVADDDNNRDTSLVDIVVQPVNDAPGFGAGGDVIVPEDAGAQSIAWATDISAGAANESDQNLNFNSLSNSNADLFASTPSIAPDGTLSFTPQADSSGTTTLEIQLQDDGGTANGGVDVSQVVNFTITIQPVNDAPNFAVGTDISIVTINETQTIPNWASNITAGPPNEAGQMLSFNIISNDNPDLFEEAPQVSSDGTLTFKPALDATGSATIGLQLQDDGSTENGGENLSTIQNFVITLNPPGG